MIQFGNGNSPIASDKIDAATSAKQNGANQKFLLALQTYSAVQSQGSQFGPLMDKTYCSPEQLLIIDWWEGMQRLQRRR